MALSLQQTRDGSHTLCNEELKQTYHSVHGAVQESIHVFIEAGLVPLLKKLPRVSVLEVGFGTGLNALLTIQKGLELSKEIHYTTLEPYPIPLEVVQELNYADYFADKARFQFFLQKIHQAAWEAYQEIVPGFLLRKTRTTLADFTSDEKFDLIYFDPFPPSAQPYLWDKSALAKLYSVLLPGGVFTTYGAMGQFKRDLKELGMQVEKLPGPPGKRQMTRATK